MCSATDLQRRVEGRAFVRFVQEGSISTATQYCRGSSDSRMLDRTIRPTKLVPGSQGLIVRMILVENR